MQGLALLLAIAFLFAELGIAQLIGAPFLDTELFQLGIRDGFALLALPGCADTPTVPDPTLCCGS